MNAAAVRNLVFCKQRLDFFEVIIFRYQPHVNLADFPCTIKDECRRQRVYAAKQRGHRVITKQHSIVHLALCDVRLHSRPSIVIHGNANHLEAFVFVLLLKIYEPGNLNLAGPAPRGPEIKQHYFSAVIGEFHLRSVRVFQSKVWCGLAIGRRFRCRLRLLRRSRRTRVEDGCCRDQQENTSFQFPHKPSYPQYIDAVTSQRERNGHR